MNNRVLTLVFLSSVMISSAAFCQNKPKATINHLAIFVMNCKASTAYYRDVIGLDTIPEPFHDGKHTWFKIGPSQSLHVIEGSTAKKDYYKNNHICFSVPSVEAFTEVLKKNNLNWEDLKGAKNMISTRVDGVKQIWTVDPDGYWIEVNDAKQ